MNKFKDTTIYKNLIKDKKRFVFISPHLDDAIFSAGGLISHLHKLGKEVIIINAFTKASTPPYTLSIKRFLGSCGYKSADDLFDARVLEDAQVTARAGAKVINLGLVDALWRKNGRQSKVAELNYVYPIFRLTIRRGFISHLDKQLIQNLGELLKQNIKQDKDTMVFCPLGIGRHTDHLIVRTVVVKNFKNVIFWEDYPYSKTDVPDSNFVNPRGLISEKVSFEKMVKEKLVNGYKSQVKAIFGTQEVKVKDFETYYYEEPRNFYPERLANYRFVSTFMKSEQIGSYSLAIYKDSRGNKVIVKRWTGKEKDLSYRWLKNEINVYKLLGLPQNQGNICTPELLQVIESKDKLYMIIKLLKGRDISKTSVKEKVFAFSKVLSFLHRIDISGQQEKIAERGPLFWILISPYAFIKAASRYSHKFISLAKGVSFIFLASPFILLRQQRVLIHRDLNDNNVFKKGNGFCVLDFELSSIADPLIDWALLFLKYSADKKFLSELKKVPEVLDITKQKRSLYALSAYMIIFAIYDLNFELGIPDLDLNFLAKVNKLGYLP